MKNDWTFNMPIDSIKTGDTLSFQNFNKRGVYHFKSNGQLEENIFVIWCARATRADKLLSAKPKETVGSWTLIQKENNALLNIVLKNKILNLSFLKKENDKIFFFANNVQ